MGVESGRFRTPKKRGKLAVEATTIYMGLLIGVMLIAVAALLAKGRL